MRGPGQLLARGWVYTGARIPSRLGEPGSLFSRYKFLQLELVVVTLLTRTRRELLKRRRTIGARIYSAASLNPASRAALPTSFLFIPASAPPPRRSHPLTPPLSLPATPFILLFFRLLINEPVSLPFLPPLRSSLFLSLSLLSFQEERTSAMG